jgi:hypothetical protein
VSSRELEDRQERELIVWVASELGISVEELTRQDFDVDEIAGNDGAVYRYRVTFGEDSDPQVLERSHAFTTAAGRISAFRPICRRWTGRTTKTCGVRNR